jgi:hypothetical protein
VNEEKENQKKLPGEGNSKKSSVGIKDGAGEQKMRRKPFIL